MKLASSTNEKALEGQYDDGFIGRVYRTTAVVWALMAALIYSHSGVEALLGLSIGAAISLGSLRLIELAVRHLLCPGMPTRARHFTLLFLLKLPLLTVVMAGAVWVVMIGLANVFALVGGVALVHGVILLKALGNLVVAALPAREKKRGIRTLSPVETQSAGRGPQEKRLRQGHPEPASGVWGLAPGD
jgi:hypothetical protein